MKSRKHDSGKNIPRNSRCLKLSPCSHPCPILAPRRMGREEPHKLIPARIRDLKCSLAIVGIYTGRPLGFMIGAHRLGLQRDRRENLIPSGH